MVAEGERENGSIKINNLKVHHTSSDAWNLKILGKLQQADFKDTYLMVNENSDGGAVIRFVNEQILDSINNSTVQAQVVGIATYVDIFKNEEEYIKSIKPDKDGIKNILEDGQLVSLNLILNNNTRLSENEKNNIDHKLDNIIDFRGTIKTCNRYKLNMMNTNFNAYYSVGIETIY